MAFMEDGSPGLPHSISRMTSWLCWSSKSSSLSRREKEILLKICEGLSNHEIADALFISKRTVDKHRANLLAKTGSKNTASLILYAIRNRLIEV